MPTRPHDAVHPSPGVYADKEACCMEVGYAGMTIREHMATQILAGFGYIHGPAAVELRHQLHGAGVRLSTYLAVMAVERADALIHALNGMTGAEPSGETP